MTVLGRISREYTVQLVSLGVLIADRLLTAGILIRAWGPSDFAAWSVALSAAGLVSMFDFGLNFYFGNKVAFLNEQGKVDEARQILMAGNLLMGLASGLGAVAVTLGFLVYATTAADLPGGESLWAAAAVLILAASARTALAVHYQLYRAHRDYARYTVVIAVTDLVRVGTTIAAAAAGAGLLGVALFSASAMVAGSVGFVLIDTLKRYPRFAYGVGLPARHQAQEIGTTSFGYWIQSAPVTLLMYLPVFLLAAAGGHASAIATFVLVRTLANFARTGLALFSVVLGIEAARRIAVGDAKGVGIVYHEGALLLGAQASVVGGVLLATAGPLFSLWTGRPDLYNPLLVWLALGPIIFLPTLSMAHSYFNSANQPWPVASGRALQLTLTLGFFYGLPVSDPATRLMAALALGEVIGFGLPITLAVNRSIEGAGLAPLARITLASLLCCAVAYGTAMLAMIALHGTGPVAVAVAILAGGAAGGTAAFQVGLSHARRATVMSAIRKWVVSS